MNNKINYSGYVEMFLDSSDDYEPYGCVTALRTAGEASDSSHVNYDLHRENLLVELSGD